MNKALSRREFLKVVEHGGRVLSALLFGKTAYNLFTENHKFFSLVQKSLEQGKALDDAVEILQSRLAPDERVFDLGEMLVDYKESWMDKVSKQSEVFTIPETNSHAIFLDITESCSVTLLPVKEKELPLHPGLRSKQIYKSLDFDSVMARKPFLTLPNPQYEDVDDMSEEENTQHSYGYYLMYAGFRNGYNWDTSASIQHHISGKRGGLILDKRGELIVATPSEFVTFDPDINNLNAQMEFAFVFDSSTLDSDIEDMESTSGLKGLIKIPEYPYCLATYYTKTGEMKTLVFSTLALFDEAQQKFGDPSDVLTILQMVNLVSLYGQRNGYARFVMGIPDVASLNALMTPLAFPVRSAVESMPENVFIGSSLERFEESYGENFTVYRTLGSGRLNLVHTSITFPWMITSSVS